MADRRRYYKADAIDGFRKIPDMARYGYTITGCWKYWGFCPSYVHEKTKKIIYFHEGRFCTGPMVLKDLVENWRPVAHDEYMFCILEMKSTLERTHVNETNT